MDEKNLLQPGQHSGFIPKDPSLTAWKAGGESGVLEQARLIGGDWRKFLTAGKWQRFFFTGKSGAAVSLETDGCVSFSAIDALQAFMNWMVANNGYTVDDITFLKSNGYFDASGLISLSPRFTAKMSGTTINGNSLEIVGNSCRHDGVIPAAAWDAPLAAVQALDDTLPSFQQDAWDIYYADPGQANIALGQAFAARFDVQYEFIAYPGAALTPSQFLDKLVVAPIQIATAVCPPWNTDAIIQPCGAGVAHATLLTFVEPNVCEDIRDHYAPFDKKFAPGYVLTYAMRFVCVHKDPPAPPAVFKHHFSTPILLGQSGTEVTALQNALKADGEFPLTVNATGYYGSITQAAVLAFQRKYGVDTAASLTQLNGTRVGLKTIAELNTLFDK